MVKPINIYPIIPCGDYALKDQNIYLTIILPYGYFNEKYCCLSHILEHFIALNLKKRLDKTHKDFFSATTYFPYTKYKFRFRQKTEVSDVLSMFFDSFKELVYSKEGIKLSDKEKNFIFEEILLMANNYPKDFFDRLKVPERPDYLNLLSKICSGKLDDLTDLYTEEKLKKEILHMEDILRTYGIIVLTNNSAVDIISYDNHFKLNQPLEIKERLDFSIGINDLLKEMAGYESGSIIDLTQPKNLVFHPNFDHSITIDTKDTKLSAFSYIYLFPTQDIYERFLERLYTNHLLNKISLNRMPLNYSKFATGTFSYNKFFYLDDTHFFDFVELVHKISKEFHELDRSIFNEDYLRLLLGNTSNDIESRIIFGDLESIIDRIDKEEIGQILKSKLKFSPFFNLKNFNYNYKKLEIEMKNSDLYVFSF